MKRMVKLALFWIGLAASAQDETGFAVAPELDAFQRFAPEAHRVLTEGTYDTFTREERFEFLVEHLRELGKVHPAAESAIRSMVEEVEAHREALRDDPKRLAEVDARENEEILTLLLEINSALTTVEQHMGPDVEPHVFFEWEQ